jgi:hypothetical protein
MIHPEFLHACTARTCEGRVQRYDGHPPGCLSLQVLWQQEADSKVNS